MPLPSPRFIGYFPKITAPRPAGFEPESVKEICSVSECISKGPAGWVQHWTHNAWGFYDSQQAAWAVTGAQSAQHDMYAYELFPAYALEGTIQAIDAAPVLSAVPGDFELLGYDIVTRSTGHFFECSPLTCNAMAREFAVNAHCLIADEVEAYQALLSMSAPGSGVEPGPYYLFRVFRKLHN